MQHNWKYINQVVVCQNRHKPNNWPRCEKKKKTNKQTEITQDHPRSAIAGLSLVLKFGLDAIYSFGDIAIFIFCRFSWNYVFTPILGSFRGIFPPNMVIYRSKPQKDHPCAETRRLSHKAWKSVQRFDLRVGSRKKIRTGQGSQKSHKVVIFRLYGEKPPLYRLKPKFAWRVISPT